jgi:cytochrome o ubiquinol oxidase operon protein cyoD
MDNNSVADNVQQGSGQKDFGEKGYILGFIFSVILTIIPFYFAYTGKLSTEQTIVVLILSAIIQLGVHLFYFLHMDSSERGRFYMLSFVFIVLIVFIVIGGSVWIMWNLNHNMMLM